MILNLYTYKGSYNSLIGPWITVAYLCDENDNFEKLVPSTKNIYVKRKHLSKFNVCSKYKLDIRFTSATDINILGDYSIFNIEKTLITQAKSIYTSSLKINKVKAPFYWYERLAVIYAVTYRNYYLDRVSTNYNFSSLDSNYEAHLNLLCSYKYLPYNYIWNNCMKAVEFIYPKPYWYKKELKEFI